MALPQEYTFVRYLSSKKSVDDRSLNRSVWDRLKHEISGFDKPVRVLELGAGIGTMIERTVDWGLLQETDYTCVDSIPENISEVFARLGSWAHKRNYEVASSDEGMRIVGGNRDVTIRPVVADVLDFMNDRANKARWDLLIANAFLDLVDIPLTLPHLFAMLKPGGLFYFTINFDGATVLQPEIDKAVDLKIESLYHKTMDERIINGKVSGDSLTGRHFFRFARDAGAEILEAGPSDWVVFSGPEGYREDEAFFLHFIVHTMSLALAGHPELDPEFFDRWIAERHRQVEEGSLVYIAHQLDFVGRV